MTERKFDWLVTWLVVWLSAAIVVGAAWVGGVL